VQEALDIFVLENNADTTDMSGKGKAPAQVHFVIHVAPASRTSTEGGKASNTCFPEKA
jgi:hypothetical protein